MTALSGNLLELTDDDRVVETACRTSLFHFMLQFWSVIEPAPYIHGWHIRALAEHLQAVTEGQIKRLIVNIPPGCSKSLSTSVFWPCWEWIRNPAARWFFVSYDQRLSTRDSVRCRTLIKSREYQRLWGNRFKIANDNDQKTYYETSAGGYRMASSVGGHGTGQHPSRVVVDDCISAMQAESELERQKVLDWWDLTMSTRGVSLGVSHVIIMQRLHENDLTGHLLKRGDYVHLCLPMRYEAGRMISTPIGWTDKRVKEGQLLAPRQFPEEAVKDMERSLGAYGTASQLQQRPRPKSGGMFKEHWFRHRRKSAPYNCRRIRFWDRASSVSDSACFTAGVLLAQDSDGNYYVEDVVHGKWEPDERNAVMRATAIRDRSRYGPISEPRIYVEAEGGSSGRDAWKSVARALDGFSVWEDRVTGKKDVRAEPWAAQLAAGNVYLIDNGESDGGGRASWDISNFVREHLLFKPDVTSSRLGRNKDIVDSCSGAYNLFVNELRVQAPRIYSFRKDDPVKKLRLLVCTADELACLVEDDLRCLLVVARDPLEPACDPVHGVRRLVAHHTITFADVDPADHQATWDQPVQPYGKPAGELVITPEFARDLWKFLLKRDRPYDAVIFQGSDDRRAYSLACGVADGLGISRNSCVEVASSDDISRGDRPLNRHIVEQVKAARGRLLM